MTLQRKFSIWHLRLTTKIWNLLFQMAVVPLLLAATSLFGKSFTLNPMGIHEGLAHVVSSFEKMDYFSTYTLTGELSWEQSFHSKILSWEIEEERVFVFSCDRAGQAYYLTCFHPKTGQFCWEKGIYSPIETEPSN